MRSALAKCGLTTKHIESQVKVLSGGEQAKVRLCKLVNKDTNLLILDEPTNHLELIYNRGLAMRKESYEEGKKIGYIQTSAMLTELKRQEEFAF